MATVRAPTWRFEWNLNTIVILLGFASSLIVWGASWEKLSSNQQIHAANIDKLDKRVTALESATRIIDAHELRLAIVEQRATDTGEAMRAIETAVGGLSSDIRVVREILTRLENRSTSRPLPGN